jgi:DNA polymerase elongation subunit (family B)
MPRSKKKKSSKRNDGKYDNFKNEEERVKTIKELIPENDTTTTTVRNEDDIDFDALAERFRLLRQDDNIPRQNSTFNSYCNIL